MIQVLEILLISYLGFNVLYIVVYAVAGSFHKAEKFPLANKLAKTLIIMPAYKDDEVIINAAIKNRDQEYLRENLDVLVVGDHLKDETYKSLEMNGIEFVKLNLETSTKARAINIAINSREKNYDMVVVLDADNHLSMGAIKKMNRAFQAGHKFIQCHRTAKNENTEMALLDAVNEEVNNHIFRKGHQTLRLSSALIGSGMAFDFKIFRSLMEGLDDEVGEDKVLEMKLLEMGETVIYMDDVRVYDEKVQQVEHFERQRSRWLATQVSYFLQFITRLPVAIVTMNTSYFNKILQTMVLPRSLMLAVVGLSALGHSFTSFWWIWYLMLSALISAISISIPKRFYKKRNLKLVYRLPRVILSMFKALTKMNVKSVEFKPTPHTYQ